MLFNSYEFILIFLPTCLIVYFFLGHSRLFGLALAFLVGASLAFYAHWDVRYVALLVGSIAFNYVIGKGLTDRPGKWLVVTGIACNIAILGFFKYTEFFVQNVNRLIGIDLHIPHIELPLGISFFTFTQIAYLVDAYRKETKGYGLLPYSLFVTIFPHLIAGPILCHKDMIPQFLRLRNSLFSHKNFSYGCILFTIGLAKKVLIADKLASWAGPVFATPETAHFITAWEGALAYTYQLYFDFSGYSDMAIGIGLLFNFHLPINFNSPYKAACIIDFWRRWHITLSTFLKNYLYIPLGGNRSGNQYRNILITMLLGGLWHGAAWTFVLWGGLHGVLLLINHLWRKLNIDLPISVAWALTFGTVVIAWVVFRSSSIANAGILLKTMFGGNGLEIIAARRLPYLLGLTAFVVFLPNSQQIIAKYPRPNRALALAAGMVMLVCLTKLNNASEFIYFQF
jgi:alginate O-acetyltransferase complex protein AlgI